MVLPMVAAAAGKLLPQAMGALSGATGAAASPAGGKVAGAARRFKYMFEPLVILVKSICNGLVRFVKAIPSFIINLKILLASSIVLGMIFGVMLVAAIVMYYMHPRPMFINRYANMDGFQQRMQQDIVRGMVMVAAYGPPPSLPGQYAEQANRVRERGEPLISDSDFTNKLDVFLKFQGTIRNMTRGGMYARVAEASLKNAGLFLDKKDNVDMEKVELFHKAFSVQLVRFCADLRSLRARFIYDRVLLETSGGDPRLHTYVSSVLELDLIFNDYMPAALDNLSKRQAASSPGKKAMNFVIFERYYAPVVNDMWKNGFMNSVRAAAKMFLDIFLWTDVIWSKIGEFIGKIPCMLAPKHQDKCRQINFNLKIGAIQSEYNVTDKAAAMADSFTQPDSPQASRPSYARGSSRQPRLEFDYGPGHSATGRRTWKDRLLHGFFMAATWGRYRSRHEEDSREMEMFGEDAREISRVLEHYDEPAANDHNDTDVVEHFGAIISLARTVASFFRNFVPLGYQLIDYGRNFINDPMMSLFGIISIIVGPIIGIIMLMIYGWLSLPIFFGCSISWIWGFIIAIVISYLYFWVALLVRIALTVGLFFVFLGIWFIDFITGGLVLKLVQCEEDPDAAEIRSNYADGNGYQRGVLGCLYPCSSGFKPRPLYFLGNTPYLCARGDRSAPGMCPQQQILRFFRGRAFTRPFAYDLYKPGVAFYMYDLRAKIAVVRETYRKRRAFLDTCSNSLDERFEPICRHVCGNLHNYKYASSGERETMRLLCSQMYCEGRHANGGLCSYITNDPKGTDPSQRMIEQGFTIFSKAFMVGIVAMVFMVIVLALIRASNKRAAAVAAASGH